MDGIKRQRGVGMKGTHRGVPLRFVFAVFLMMTALFVIPAGAVEKEGITTHLVAYKITEDARGAEQREPADYAKPGEVIEYEVVYKNGGRSNVNNLLGQLPIPTEMTYVADSGEPLPVYASVDGVQFYKAPLTRTVKQSDGTEKTEPIPYSEYRALQWDLGSLAAGEEKQVKARVRLNTGALTEDTETKENNDFEPSR